MDILWIDGNSLTIEDVIRVSRKKNITVKLADHARDRMNYSRKAVEKLIESGVVAYGITTGFGFFQNHVISPEQVQQLQRNIIMSHACGVGEPFKPNIVRAMLLIRANTLAKGFSGIRPIIVDMLLELLNNNVLPVVPCQGSLGASGDLAPLAHIALILIGLGEADIGNNKRKKKTLRVKGEEALRFAGLNKIELEAKEGLALTNGTSLISALASFAVYDAGVLCQSSDIVAALSMEALAFVTTALDPRIHLARPHLYQISTATYLRHLLDGSNMIYPVSNDQELYLPQLPFKVQDAYSLRCVPQVHGAIQNVVNHVREILEKELNSATDNPLLLPTDSNNIEGSYEALSGGNFHGEPLALALDYLKTAITDLGNISERRIARLVDSSSNGGITPPFLISDGGLNSGFMIVQYTAASLASENKVLAHPASADSIPTSANQEDHVSMGSIAGRQALNILENVQYIVACEAFAAAQAIDLRKLSSETPLDLGKGTNVAYNFLRKHIRFINQDEVMEPNIVCIQRLIQDESFINEVRSI